MRKIYLAFWFISLTSVIFAQIDPYYSSRTLKKAFANQTRSPMGIPAVNYWQNSSAYQIVAELQIKKPAISGTANITYSNNSPDTLDKLVFNLYQDIYKKGNSRDWDIGDTDLHDGTQIKSLTINGFDIDVKNRREVNRSGTKLVVSPKQKLLPGEKTQIKIEWEVSLPEKRAVRMGKQSDSAIFVAYWYPQIAVYDDIDGWDMISYNGSVEFYNDFNSYDVQLTVPENFVVWATGMLQNMDEILSKEVVLRYQQALNKDEVTSIVQMEDYAKNNVFKKNPSKTWHFKADNVPDFSFAAAIGFLWDGVGLIVDKTNNRRVLVEAVYPKGTKHYEQVANYSRKSINYLSSIMPGVPYPYPHMTTFCSGRKSGGMESPMMANNGVPDEEASNFGLTLHEISHSYMPFYMGTNEKKYAWMDEGWASLWPHKLVDSLYPDKKYLENTVRTFENAAGTEMDIPPMVPNQLLGANYSSLRLASYVRPAMAYHFLEETLGSEMFKKALTTYISLWNGKHPIPSDFFQLFELVTDKDLFWYFKPWFYDNAFPDLAIRKITSDRKIVIENIGGLPLPVKLELLFTNGTKETITFPITIWNTGENTILIESPEGKIVQNAILGDSTIPDVNKTDNVMLVID